MHQSIPLPNDPEVDSICTFKHFALQKKSFCTAMCPEALGKLFSMRLPLKSQPAFFCEGVSWATEPQRSVACDDLPLCATLTMTNAGNLWHLDVEDKASAAATLN